MISRSLKGDVDGDGGIEDCGGLAEATLPRHVVGQLAQAVGDAAQIDAAIALPRAPRHLAVCRADTPAPCPQRVSMRLQKQTCGQLIKSRCPRINRC